MVEVTLIAPTAQIQTLGAGGQQAQSATQTGVPATSYLSPGALVSGIITGKDSGGSYLLKTDQGTFALHSNTPLTYNSDVLIRVDNSNEGTAGARIISVNGEAFATFSAPVQQESDSVSPSLLAKAGVQGNQQSENVADAPLTPVKSIPIPAITVAVPVTSTGITTPQAPIPVGTSVILQTTVPVTPETSVPQTAVPTQPVAILTANTVPPADTPPQTANAPALPSSNVSVTPTAVALPQNTTTTPQVIVPPPATPEEVVPVNVAKLIVAQPQALTDDSAPSSFFTPAAATPPPPPVVQNTLYAAYAKATPLPSAISPLPNAPILLNANVTTNHSDGTLTLSTAQGTFTVKPENTSSSVHIPQGTPLTVTLPAAYAFLASESSDVQDDTLLTTLKQILGTVQTKAPTVASELLTRLPTMGSDFFSSSIAFMSALLTGNTRKILGENTTALLQDSGAEDMLDKLDAHAANVAQNFQQPTTNTHPTANWQSLTLPFIYQGAIQEARIYVKRDAPRKERENKKPTSDTRFIVEITFSDLGELQLDGIVLPKEKIPLFDLIVRSQVPFLPDEQQEIIQIYNNAAQLTGFKGSIGFSVTKDFPVRPLAEMQIIPPRDIIA